MRPYMVSVVAAYSVMAAHAAPPQVQTVTADNGAVFWISGIRSIDNRYRGSNTSYAMAYVTDEDQRVTMFTFSCDGQYSASRYEASTDWRRIPSRSLLARISQIACEAVR